MPLSKYANSSKLAEVTVLARQDTMTCKGRDKSIDMSIQIYIVHSNTVFAIYYNYV